MGIVAIAIAIVAWGGAAACLWLQAGWILGAVEGALVAAGLITTSFVFCSHCPLHRRGCMHLFVGIPARLCRDRSSEPYTALQEIVAGVSLIVASLFPIPWLLRSPLLLAVYGFAMLLVLVLILAAVCPKCGNERCGVKKLIGRR
jgi:hypothetical protein